MSTPFLCSKHRNGVEVSKQRRSLACAHFFSKKGGQGSKVCRTMAAGFLKSASLQGSMLCSKACERRDSGFGFCIPPTPTTNRTARAIYGAISLNKKSVCVWGGE